MTWLGLVLGTLVVVVLIKPIVNTHQIKNLKREIEDIQFTIDKYHEDD
jgi:uncharacterized membrane-anchored protein YhcB (DUF1043 family)